MIEVFRTNVYTVEQSDRMIAQLQLLFPTGKINFDLEDCDNILRVESESISHQTVVDLFLENGFQAEVLI